MNGRAAQPTVEAVRPGVVRAADHPAAERTTSIGTLSDQLGAAMTADVVERPQRVTAVDDHDRLPDEVDHAAGRPARRRRTRARRRSTDPARCARARPPTPGRPRTRRGEACDATTDSRPDATVPRMVRRSDVAITTGDGERLAATLWLPDGDGPFAAVLEALPYRKDDVTSSYHESLRALRRGRDSPCSGSTSAAPDRRRASPTDEYPDVERDDLRTAIEWLADAVVVERPGRHVRHVVLGVQLAADGGRPACRRCGPWSPSTPPTTATPTTCTSAAVCCAPSIWSTTRCTWWR